MIANKTFLPKPKGLLFVEAVVEVLLLDVDVVAVLPAVFVC